MCVGNNRRFYGRKWHFWGGGGLPGRAAGPAAQPPTRAQPVCFDAVETACGRKAAVCRNLRGAPAGAFVKKIVITFGGAGLIKWCDLYGYRRGGTFDSPKVPKSDLRLRPKNPRTGTPARNGSAVPDRGLNGAYKVPQAHLPPPNLPRFGGGERPPFLCKPPAPLTITMGQRLAVFASPNTPSDRLPPCACPPIRAPFPPSGKGVGGKGRYARGYLGSDSVRSTD